MRGVDPAERRLQGYIVGQSGQASAGADHGFEAVDVDLEAGEVAEGVVGEGELGDGMDGGVAVAERGGGETGVGEADGFAFVPDGFEAVG